MESNNSTHIHFIAIGGAAMHNLAIALHNKGYKITGSDDEIFEPSRGRLEKYGLLPTDTGWDKNNIHQGIDVVILGMHARKDNPELMEARHLGLKIYSYPEYVYERTKNKTRVVIGGSHGKTTVTSMIMHVLKKIEMEFDYLVGSLVQGFETMVGLSKTSKVAILEGDEYLSSPIDPRPKFHLYHPHIALVTGIAWDHINVFPTFEEYVKQFRIFTEKIEPNGHLIYYRNDENLRKISHSVREDITRIPYTAHKSIIRNNRTYLIAGDNKVEVPFFGKHNMENLQGAKHVCSLLNINETAFYEAIRDFSGAGKRLQHIGSHNNRHLYMDFAHSPSKLKATIDAVKSQYPNHFLVAVMELHTFSSLNKNFLDQYHRSMDRADLPVVFFNPETVAHKKLEMITEHDIKSGFGNKKITVCTQRNDIFHIFESNKQSKTIFLMMSSGNFGGINIEALTNYL
ncbi:MAG: UDP-N-acetylmuramate--L-alanine ligase [Bacteroidota bacterium]